MSNFLILSAFFLACAAPVLLAVLIVERRWQEPVFEAVAEAAGIGGKLLLWLVYILLPIAGFIFLVKLAKWAWCLH